MSFLDYNDKSPGTLATFKGLKAEEFLYKDPESGTYIPLVPIEPGAPLPYYAKPAKVDFLSGSNNTVVDQTGIDVIDNAGNTASELTSTALTLGDLGGNAVLDKAGIQAANNLKDAIYGDITDVTNASQSVLIFDTATAKVSKTSTFRLNESATEYSTLSPFTVQLKNASNYNNVTSSGLTTYYAPSNALCALTGSTIAVGYRGADFNLDTTLPNAKLGRTSLKIFDGTTTHTLDASAIKAAANLATVSTTTPSTANKMVVYNPTTSLYAYHDTPTGVSVPAYILPTKILMRGVNASFQERGIEIASADAVGSKSFMKVTDGDSAATSPYVSIGGSGITFHPSSPDDFNDRTLEYGDVNRVKNGWNVLTATLGNNIADASLNALASYSAATNTVTFTPANYSTFNSVRLVTSTIRAGDTVRISFGTGNQLGSSRMYLIPLRFSSFGDYPCIQATSNAGYCYVAMADVATGGGTNFTNIPVIFLFSLRTVPLTEVRIDLHIRALNRFPEVATVTL